MELLKGKTAMVTGGTRGIGYAIVKMYLDNGASVALCGSRQETVDKALDKLRAENPDYKVIGLCPDLQNPAEVEKAVATVKETFGSLDIMVNNAGVSARDRLYDYKPEDFAKTMALNQRAGQGQYPRERGGARRHQDRHGGGAARGGHKAHRGRHSLRARGRARGRGERFPVLSQRHGQLCDGRDPVRGRGCQDLTD